jgi:DNA-binding response OmpR family regulator
MDREFRTRQPRHDHQEPRHQAWHYRSTILLVEDDTEMRIMLASALRQDGYTVVEAADGDAALEWLGPAVLAGEPARLPALIVSDIRLPYVSGLQLLECLQLGKQRPPVILITGFGDSPTHAEARRLGAECVLDKPFDVEELRAAVRQALLRPRKPPESGRRVG